MKNFLNLLLCHASWDGRGVVLLHSSRDLNAGHGGGKCPKDPNGSSIGDCEYMCLWLVHIWGTIGCRELGRWRCGTPDTIDDMR